MSIIEVLLLIIGAGILTAGYLLPARKDGSAERLSADQEKLIREFLEQEMEDAGNKIEEIVDETVTYSVEKTERAMERLSNEKIMAINEYSDTVLQEIHKNHEEAVFLYDMLNNKHKTFMTTVSEAGKTVAEVKQTLQDAQATAEFAPIRAKEVQDMDSVLKKPEPVAESEPKSENEAEAGTIPKASAAKKKGTSGVRKKKAAMPEENVGNVSSDGQPYDDAGPEGNNNDRILELHKAGKSNVAIAKELGLGIGEVKLVIDLYKGTGD